MLSADYESGCTGRAGEGARNVPRGRESVGLASSLRGIVLADRVGSTRGESSPSRQSCNPRPRQSSPFREESPTIYEAEVCGDDSLGHRINSDGEHEYALDSRRDYYTCQLT